MEAAPQSGNIKQQLSAQSPLIAALTQNPYFHRHLIFIKLSLVYAFSSLRGLVHVWAPRLTDLTMVSWEAGWTAAAGRTAAGAEVEALVHTVRTDLSLAQTAVDLCDVARRAATRPRCNVTQSRKLINEHNVHVSMVIYVEICVCCLTSQWP